MNDLTTTKSFEERMKDRIREDIGKLMTDDELSKLVRRATNDIFFKGREVKDGYHTIEEEPFIYQIVKELLAASVRKHTEEFLEKNKSIVIDEINKVITLGMGKALLEAISFQFNNDLINFQTNLINNIQNRPI